MTRIAGRVPQHNRDVGDYRTERGSAGSWSLVGMMIHSLSSLKLILGSGATALGSVKRRSHLNLKQFLVAMSLILLIGVPFAVFGKDAQPSAADPVLEERVLSLAKELRCLVCQNETLADSRADLAIDLRNQIREQMKAGKSDKEIIAFLTDRYGKFILYRPPMDPTTYLLWFGPFILLLGGLLILFRYVKQRRELIVEKPLSKDEHLRAEALLKPSGKEIA